MKVAQSCLTLLPYGLYSPWNSPGQGTGAGSLSLLQGIFPTQGLNPGLPHCRRILYQLSAQGSPIGRSQGCGQIPQGRGCRPHARGAAGLVTTSWWSWGCFPSSGRSGTVERVGPTRAAGLLASAGRREVGCSPGPPIHAAGGGGRTKTQSPSQPPSGPQGAPYANPPLSKPSLPPWPGKLSQECRRFIDRGFIIIDTSCPELSKPTTAIPARWMEIKPPLAGFRGIKSVSPNKSLSTSIQPLPCPR